MRNVILFSLTLGAVVAACAAPGTTDTSADWERRIGVVEPALSSIQMLKLPPEVRVGEPFTVTVRTLGSSSCTRAAGMDVASEGLSVELTPYDEYARNPAACTDDLHAFEHTARVTVAVAGQARVRLHARALTGEALRYDAAVTVRP
jgi:hypothetical protein